jgi:acetyl-CoA carboxylase biotin carboxyl carrier protein
MSSRLVLGVQRCPVLGEQLDGEIVHLTSPSVGWFTSAVPRGNALAAGEVAGVLITLGRASQLIVPDDVAGVVSSNPPERVHAPVGYGTVLYELAPRAAGAAANAVKLESHAPTASGALVFRSPHTGRFWHRASPADRAFVTAGQVIESGATIGLIEVMKTFATVQYAAGPHLPPRARVLRILATDGAEVAERDPLLELEPA